MTEQEFLTEAYRKYPEGTSIYSSIDGENGSQLYVKYPLKFKKSVQNSKDVIWNGDCGWLHSDGRWAEIISYPEGYNPTKDLLKELVIW